MNFIKTWRWFGDKDPVQLTWLKEMGVEEVVTALHNIPNGDVWHVEEIRAVKNKIERVNLKWTVVESLPVTEAIKTGNEFRQRHIDNYKKSLVNLATCGIKTVVYNFMPVLDWARTDVNYKLTSGAYSMLFDPACFAAFDIFILKRKNAGKDYSTEIRQKALLLYENMTNEEAEELAYNIIILTQGFVDGAVENSSGDYKRKFLELIENYKEIDRNKLLRNLEYFLNEVMPVAEKCHINMAIHPDDPPFPVLGLPRICSTIDDFYKIKSMRPSLNNGIAFCAGSLSAREDNNLMEIVDKFSDRIHFVHLRNTKVLKNGSFYETGHLNGRIDMFRLVEKFIDVMNHRKINGREDCRIPLRPDHGLKYFDDFNLKCNPGYSFIGRMKGFVELNTMETILNRNMRREG